MFFFPRTSTSSKCFLDISAFSENPWFGTVIPTFTGYFRMFNLLLLAGQSHGLQTDPNFDVISCNNADNNLPELTLSIKQEYLNTNLSWLANQEGFLKPVYRP